MAGDQVSEQAGDWAADHAADGMRAERAEAAQWFRALRDRIVEA